MGTGLDQLAAVQTDTSYRHTLYLVNNMQCRKIKGCMIHDSWIWQGIYHRKPVQDPSPYYPNKLVVTVTITFAVELN